MAKQSKVLLLDEPTSGLDPKASNEFSDLLLKMKESGVATLMATHDIFRAKETGTKIGIMKSGQLVDILSADTISAKDLEGLYLKHMHN
jgi:ABC-2 type transport system ATP-binding protein